MKQDEKLPTTLEVGEQARRLVALIEDPHPGLATWQIARNEAAAKLHRMLGQVLEKMKEVSG